MNHQSYDCANEISQKSREGKFKYCSVQVTSNNNDMKNLIKSLILITF